MTTATDSFTRANETPLAAPWSTVFGISGFNLTSNAANAPDDTSDRGSIYTGSSFGNDQSSKANLTTPGSATPDQGVGLGVRYATGVRTGYRFVTSHAASNNCTIARFIAGAGTVLVTFTQAWSDGATWEFRVTGPAAAAKLELFLNGALVQTFTDNSSLASGSPGITYSTNSTSGTIDDWVGTDEFAVPVMRPTFNPIPFMGGH